MITILADENIPLVGHYFGYHDNEITLKPGRAITHSDCKSADILLVRSVTRVNQALLHDTPVRFVGTTTAGYDHLDTEWLDRAGIQWAAAPGCNAVAVAEYVVSLVAALHSLHFLKAPSPLRAAVIGVGHTGSLVAEHLNTLGFQTLCCDPLRAEHEPDFKSIPLEEIDDCDLVSLHVPLEHQGPYPTYHFIDKPFLKRQRKNTVIINTSRGEVIDTQFLKKYAQECLWCLDVFENEPWIDTELLQTALITTPHIAGYSIESKYRGIEMIYQEALKRGLISACHTHTVAMPEESLCFSNQKITWESAILRIFNPFTLSKHMKSELSKNPNCFDAFRKNAPMRHEWSVYRLTDLELSEKDYSILSELGFASRITVS